jgi:hypothetical protein
MKKSRFWASAALIILVAAGAIWYIIDNYYERQSSQIVMYKNPGCQCCDKWASYLQDHGYSVRLDGSVSVQSVKADHNVPYEMSSCHTALIDGYVVEGHVPVDAIERLLNERPDAVGLAVPGMPVGSPGMERGGYTEPYDVFLFDENGDRTVFESYQ